MDFDIFMRQIKQLKDSFFEDKPIKVFLNGSESFSMMGEVGEDSNGIYIDQVIMEEK